MLYAKCKQLMRSKWSDVLIFLLFFLIPFVIYGKYIFNGQTITSGDALSLYCNEFFARDVLRSGHLPVWLPYSANGVPYAETLMGAFYPTVLLLSWAPDSWFMFLSYSLFFTLGGFYMYLFLHRLGCKRGTALCVALIYALSVHMGGLRKSHVMIIQSIAILPILMYYIEGYLQTRKRRCMVAAGLVTGVLLLNIGVSIQYTSYMLAFVFVYALWRCIRNKFPLGRTAGDVGVYLGVAAGLSAVQMIPTLLLMLDYAQYGMAQVNFEYFQSYSIHPAKLATLLFPKLFGGMVQAYGPWHSSELDMEIFLGVIAFTVILYTVFYRWREKEIQLPLCLALVAFAFACSTHIPGFASVFYRIPMLGSFRCPSRILFLFVFFLLVILARGLDGLFDDKDSLRRLYKFSGILFLSVFALFFIFGVGILFVDEARGYTREIISVGLPLIKQTFMPTLSALALLTVTLRVLLYCLLREKVSYRSAAAILLAVCTVATIVETYPDASATSPMPLTVLEEPAEISLLKQNLGMGKVVLTQTIPGVGREAKTFYYGTNILCRFPTLNSYHSLNNPRLYNVMESNATSGVTFSNSSGLFIAFPSMLVQLSRNDVLSMLGVKYIEDVTDVLDSALLMMGTDEMETKARYETMTLPEAAPDATYSVISLPLDIEEDTFYQIDITAEAAESPAWFSVDFYGTDYDASTQERAILISPEKLKYTVEALYSGETVPEDACMRLISSGDVPVTVSDLTVSVYNMQSAENIYKPFVVNDTVKLYENTKAKEIFYKVDTLQSITGEEDIYNDPYAYNFENTSYASGVQDTDLSSVNTRITDVAWESESRISGKIVTDGDTFINFSQNYYPSWNAYVDGKRVENYEVNGVIQGAFVPAGEHTLTFAYEPVHVYICLAISLLTLLGAAAWLALDKKAFGGSQR